MNRGGIKPLRWLICHDWINNFYQIFIFKVIQRLNTNYKKYPTVAVNKIPSVASPQGLWRGGKGRCGHQGFRSVCIANTDGWEYYSSWWHSVRSVKAWCVISQHSDPWAAGMCNTALSISSSSKCNTSTQWPCRFVPIKMQNETDEASVFLLCSMTTERNLVTGQREKEERIFPYTHITIPK